MSTIAKTKQELLDAIEEEYRLLRESFAGMSTAEMETPGVCHQWSTKDVLAHLVEWKKMFLGWYEEGVRGGTPRVPSADFKWNQTPALNDRIFHKWRAVKLDVVLAEQLATHEIMLKLARSLSEEDLFRKQLYPWMGTLPLSRWIAAQTSSHYRWARTRIRKARKARA